MQGFTTSAPVCTTTTTTAPSRVDACVLPSLADAPYDPYAHVRVPLLPSVRAASVAGRAAEEPQRPFVPAEMVVVAADPANVAHAALTEVEGFSVDGVELGFAHGMDLAPGTRMEQGMIRDIWKGLVDDVFGPGAGAGASTGMGADAGAAGAKPSTAL